MTTMARLKGRTDTARSLAVSVLAAALLVPVTSAFAAPAPEGLWKACESGSEAGQCRIPRGIAAEPNPPGHLYVSDQSNSRIEEFTAWGEFVKAWGWGVRDGSASLQTCTKATGCQAGIAGSGAGQFNRSNQGVAVDSFGDIYVIDRGNNRVQKFDPEGNFLLMFGGDVNKTKVEEGAPETQRNICTAASGDVCQAGTAGTGNGQFGTWAVGGLITVDPTNRIYVGDVERIQQFEPNGNYVQSIPLAGDTVEALAADPDGNLFYAAVGKEHVRKITPTGATLCTTTVDDNDPMAVATDSDGGLEIVNDFDPTAFKDPGIAEFDSSCNREEAPVFGKEELEDSTGIATASACFSAEDGLYVGNAISLNSFIRAYKPNPDNPECPPPAHTPEIGDQFASSVSADGAVVRARINPVFWADTRYYVEYGTGTCTTGGCPARASFPGIPLGAGVVNQTTLSKGVVLTGLSPSTTYHFRFVAESSGGGPVYGVDPNGKGPGEASFEVGLEGAFTTFWRGASDNVGCSNQAYRIGPATKLPDCRAYEMVSPLDKAGGDIITLPSSGLLGSIEQAAPNGNKLAYASYRPFAGALSSPVNSQYVAVRDPDTGWLSRAINPPLQGRNFYNVKLQKGQFQLLSEDLCQGWFWTSSEPVLAVGGQPGYPNLYRERYCDASSPQYEALTTVAPTFHQAEEGLDQDGGESNYYFAAVGKSADGSHTLFQANDRLTADASEAEDSEGRIFQLYESDGTGALRLVSVLPDGSAAEVNTQPGTGQSKDAANVLHSNVHNAVSNDASRVYWTASSSRATPGALYLRQNPLAPQAPGGECAAAAPGEACTALLSAGPARFWTANPSGSRAIYSVGGQLFEYDADAEASSQIVGQFDGLLGWSEDARRLYLVSGEILAAGATAGQPNLYLYEAGQGFTYVATLAGADVTVDTPGPVAAAADMRTARVSPDGLHAAFMSTAPLTGFDSRDVVTGQSDAEVFLYDASTEGLNCVSCNPTGVRPAGHQLGEIRAAAEIPGWQYQFNPTRVLSADGDRVFFETTEALVPTDTNSRQDVYEWEAPGAGDCTVADATFTSTTGGCVRLISSGQSNQDSTFLDASGNGSDVFFATGQSLLATDPGLIDVYDARIEGGFPASPAISPCEGESCQPAAQAPPPPSPASASFHGAGNVREGTTKTRKCSAGKRKAKKRGGARCVKKKAHRKKQRARHRTRHSKSHGRTR